jgi:hypothetical protein
MNPVDYVHHALNLMIDPLDKTNPEYELIKKYVDNTRTSQNQYDIETIFKIQR